MRYSKKIIGSAVILLILAIFLAVGLILNKPKAHKLNEDDIFVESTSKDNVKNIDSKSVTVYINGEVKKPGVYTLKAGSIIEDLVKAAGGFTEEANPNNNLNLARKLKDEDYFFVDKKADTATISGLTANAKSTVNASNGSGKVNLNSATLEELDKLPGVGPSTAQKIIDYREKNGAYGSVDDLKKVGGIGDKTINNFRDKVDIR